MKFISISSLCKFCSLQKAKFLGAGILNTIFGYALYVTLVFLGTPYFWALFIATVVGVVFNYFSFGKIVFQEKGGRIVFVKFLISYGVIYALNSMFLSLLTNTGLFNAYVAQALCVPLSVLLSWLLMNYWVYKKAVG